MDDERDRIIKEKDEKIEKHLHRYKAGSRVSKYTLSFWFHYTTELNITNISPPLYYTYNIQNSPLDWDTYIFSLQPTQSLIQKKNSVLPL